MKRIFVAIMLGLLLFPMSGFAASGDRVVEGRTADSISSVAIDVTGVTDGNIPYMQAAGAGFGDSPLSTDGTDLTASGDLTVQGRDLSVGVENTQQGRFSVRGGSTTDGAKINLYNADNEDGTIGSYSIEADNLDLWISASSSGYAQIYLAGMDFSMYKDAEAAEMIVSTYHDTEATSPTLIMRKAEGTEASHATPVDDNAVLGIVTFHGYDGSGWHEAARIEARIDGTPSDGTDMPGELSFWTVPDNSATAAERMTIDDSGEAVFKGVLTAKPDGTNEVFQVNDGTIDFTDGNAGTTGTATVDSSGHISYNKNFAATDLDGIIGSNTPAAITGTTIAGTGVMTVSPDGTNEVLQVNDGSVDFTDGNAGTAGTLTIASDGDLSYNKEFTATVLNTSSSTTPGVVLVDSDTDDEDDGVHIYGNATATGTGAEVYDVYFRAQGAQGTAGTMASFAHFDGSQQSLSLIGGQKRSRTASATDYNPSAATNDYIIAITNTDSARAVTISTEDGDTGTTDDPRIFIVKDESGGAGSHNITISLEEGGTIDGAATAVIAADYGAITLYVDGTNGWIY